MELNKERLAELIGNIRGKQQRQSQTTRNRKARGEQKLQAEEESALKNRGDESVICSALCLVSFITRDLQNNHHNTFACCLAQINLNNNKKLENCVTLYGSLKNVQVIEQRLKFLRKCLKN